MKRLLLLTTVFLSTTAFTLEERTFSATIVRVTDGDSVVVRVVGWPIPFNPMVVRLDGIDAPESRRQDAKCMEEHKLGLIAKGWLKAKLPKGTKVKVIWSGTREKFGRLVAVVKLGNETINKSLVRLGHAVEYHGGTKPSWCK